MLTHLLSVTLIAMATATADPSPPPVEPLPQPKPVAVVDRVLRDPALTESSGLALSPTHDGVLWTLNDSGNPPVLYAVGRDGRTAARLKVTGVPNQDWEAVAAWRNPDGKALLAVGDIGDNAAVRRGIEVDVLAEPTRLANGSAAPLRRLRLSYPAGPADAEALVVEPRRQRMYVITKGLLRAQIYAVPQRTWPGSASDSATLELVGAVGMQLATDAAALPSGHVLVRNYGTAMLLAPLPAVAGAGEPQPLGMANLPSQRQGEGIAATGQQVYLSSEGDAAAVLRMAMPQPFAVALTRPSATGSPVAAPAPGSAPGGPSVTGSGTAGSGQDDGFDLLGGLGRLGALGLVGLLAVVGLVAVGRRRRGALRR